jgi:hypothetical protein
LAEAVGEIVVSSGLKQRKRAFQMAVRFGELSGEPVRDPEETCAMPASGESGLASTSLRNAAARALIAANSPRTKLAAQRP